MARSHYDDFLQVGRFHILDVTFSIPPVLVPVYGFARCSLPSLNLDIREIPEGNYEYPRKMVKGASVSNIVLEQGVSMYNSDFWDWTRKAVVGRKPARDLLLVQFSRIEGSSGFASSALSAITGFNTLTTSIPAPKGGQVPGDKQNKIPGKAWLMKGCRPVSYKPGTDFDGISQDISIAQLEVCMEEFEEFVFG